MIGVGCWVIEVEYYAGTMGKVATDFSGVEEEVVETVVEGEAEATRQREVGSVGENVAMVRELGRGREESNPMVRSGARSATTLPRWEGRGSYQDEEGGTEV